MLIKSLISSSLLATAVLGHAVERRSTHSKCGAPKPSDDQLSTARHFRGVGGEEGCMFATLGLNHSPISNKTVPPDSRQATLAVRNQSQPKSRREQVTQKVTSFSLPTNTFLHSRTFEPPYAHHIAAVAIPFGCPFSSLGISICAASSGFSTFPGLAARRMGASTNPHHLRRSKPISPAFEIDHVAIETNTIDYKRS
ncbi:hypothetical protein G7046_g58 [Stylonectria norvegica]|nr:hypothetical protein G7046_g58 [Stylonectria norvegica]